MVRQHAGGVGRCAKARGIEPVYAARRGVGIGKLSDSLCLFTQNGGWVWSISSSDLFQHRVKVLRQSTQAFLTYEEARRDAELALEQLREGH
ncbi:hypothetical protein CR51_00925 [Caballeronia megalochromosomata]|nr:hypothetical protein CR51_00925 [Caballeronia megalochromosomata]